MRIAKYKTGDEHEIVKLFKFAFGKEMSLEHWNWRFAKNPDFAEPMIYLMWDEEKLVGHYAVGPNKMIVDGKECLAALSMTTMTHPEYGGRGIFTKLAKELYLKEFQETGLNMVWGFPNNNSHRGFIKNLDWKNVTTIPSFSMNTSGFRFRDSSLTPEFTKVESLSDSNIATYQNLQANYQIKVSKSKAYFEWRYSHNPLNEYTFLSNQDSGAFMIVKRFETQVDIVEWAISFDFNQTKSAINSILDFYKENEISQINLWMPLDDPRHIDLEKLGFVNTVPITYLGYTALNEKIKVNPSSWFFQMGDSDVY